MKYCTYCGQQIHDNAVICVHCGCKAAAKKRDVDLIILIQIFLILGCVIVGWTIIPLAWCIPMTVTIFKKLKHNEPISMALKICTLLFVSLIAGICLLCIDN